MAEWGADKEAFIEKLRKAGGTIHSILDKDPGGLVFSLDERMELQELMRRNEKVLTKLQKNEFTVAVVGLEKAGKSTLGNALLGDIFLPEYTERCTYTTTEIKAGSEDSGEIVFYSHDEFQRDFQKMLDAIQYQMQSDAAGMDIPLASFNAWWESMEEKDPRTFEKYNGTTVEDIRAILQGRDVIRQYLGQSAKKFIGADNLQSQSFQLFITGIEEYGTGPVKRSPAPYAVKKVNICSTQLGDMKHIVLYDVPGFDSPTDLHKKQTAEMLRAADAIILVTNVGDRPNLTGTQLDMLRKGRDEDNIPLSDKAFVFGNKIDRAGNKQVALDNQAALVNDAVNKHRIAKKEHVVCGSAKAYLESLGKMSEDEKRRGPVQIMAGLKEWDLPDGDGVMALWNKMQHYYAHDRYDVLRQRAERTLHDAEKFLQDILDKQKEAASVSGLSLTEMIPCSTKLHRRLKLFIKEAKSIAEDCRRAIGEERPFSRLIQENIDEIYPDIDEECVLETERAMNVDISSVSNIDGIDARVRENLQVRFAKEVVKRTADKTLEKEEGFYAKLADKFLEVMEVEKSSPYHEELTASARDLFEDILKEEDGERCRFNTLVERFTTNPIETLIQSRFASQTRCEKVLGKDSLPQFISLAAYYVIGQTPEEEELDVDDEELRRQFFSQILAHEKLGGQRETENEAGLRAFFEENKAQLSAGAAMTVDLLPLGKWAKLLARAGVKFGEQSGLAKKAKKQLEDAFYQMGWESKQPDDREKDLGARVAEVCQSVPTLPKPKLVEVVKELSTIASDKATQQSNALMAEYPKDSERNVERRKRMIAEINTDIEILRDITVHAVVAAIGLEKAFTSVIINNVNLIRDNAEATENNKFDAWIDGNLPKLKEKEYAQMEGNAMQAQAKKNIIETIENLLGESEA